ncbi:MAG: hypothetical protein KFF68_12010 [Desulfosarcina sp.]|nr:hypothetical protein [Desulfosarcina sp.]
MDRERSHRLSAHVQWMACLSVALFWSVVACGALSASPLSDEVYFYREKTGDSVKEVTWRLTKGATYILTYTSPVERHVTTTGTDYDTRRWQVTAENGKTLFSAERIGQSIVVRGMFKGEPVDKQLAIDESPWYQATSLSLRELVASGDSERIFWTIRMDTLTAHKIRAIKKGVESLDPDGSQKALLWIRLSLPGMLAPFWKSDYWFALPEGVFYRFKGPSGPPGSPTTLVTRATR